MTPRPTPERTPGTESVWDYPRPPAVRSVAREVTIRFGDRLIAQAYEICEVLETSHPPTVYIDRGDFVGGVLQDADGSSFCEFKGRAGYLDVVAGGVRASRAAWYYPRPAAGFEVLQGKVSLYPGLMQECRVDGELVTAQPGGFYGGWITSRVSGPFKGIPGSTGW